MNVKDDLYFGFMLVVMVNGLVVGSYCEMVVVLQMVEEYGFDLVWLCDYFLMISFGEYVKVVGIVVDIGFVIGIEIGGVGQCVFLRLLFLFECWIVFVVLFCDIMKLWLGISVLCNFYCYFFVLVKMVVMLDVIFQGCFDLGLGVGWFWCEL